MSDRVVVTGVGIWSCIGKNVEEVKRSLYNGDSGIGVDNDRLEYGYHSALTGIVPKPNLKKLLDRRVRTGMSEEAEYAFMASKEAFEMAGMDDDYLRKNEVGVIFGNDSSAKAPVRGASFWKMLMTLLRPARPRLRSDIISGSPMQSGSEHRYALRNGKH